MRDQRGGGFNRRLRGLLGELVVIALFCPPASLGQDGGTTNLTAARDNTLYESPTGHLSNALGNYFFCGRSKQSGSQSIRRGVIAFDLSSIPAGMHVHAVELQLYMDQTIAGDTEVRVHRLEADWGAQSSDASTVGGEGTGVEAGDGDATWLHRFYNELVPASSIFWSEAGGDFAATASAVTVVGMTPGYRAWRGYRLVADVQQWLDHPSSNFGWIVLGDESTTATAKRFVSRENIDFTRHPKLVVTYGPAPLSTPAAADIAATDLEGTANEDFRLRIDSATGVDYYLEVFPQGDTWQPVAASHGVAGTGGLLWLEHPGGRTAVPAIYRVIGMSVPGP